MVHCLTYSARTVAVAGVLLAAGTIGAPATAQQKVGVVGAVVPQAQALTSGQPPQPLTVGQDITLGEHITTDKSGSVQILFFDQSMLTVAPNSEITIDEFITAIASQRAPAGVPLKFLPGAPGSVTIKSNGGTVGIRG